MSSAVDRLAQNIVKLDEKIKAQDDFNRKQHRAWGGNEGFGDPHVEDEIKSLRRAIRDDLIAILTNEFGKE